MSRTSARRQERPVLTVLPSKEESIPSRGSVVERGLSALILLSPLYYGGNSPTVVLLLEAVVFLVALLVCAGLLLKQSSSAVPGFLQQLLAELRPITFSKPAAVFLLLVLLFPLLQVVPLPISLLSTLSPKAGELYGWAGEDRGTLSLAPAQTAESLRWLVALIILSAGVIGISPKIRREKLEGRRRYEQLSPEIRSDLEALTERDQVVESLLGALIWSGFICGALGVLHWVFQSELYLGYFTGGRDPISAQRSHYPFANPDHLSVLLEISSIAALLRLLRRRQFIALKDAALRGVSSKRVDTLAHKIKTVRALAPEALLFFSILLFTFPTASRAGVTLAVLGSIVLWWMSERILNRALPVAAMRKAPVAKFLTSLKTPATLFLALMALLFFLGGSGRDLITTRLEYGLVTGYDELRLAMVKLAVDIWSEFPIFGVGFGAFRAAASVYAPLSMMGWTIDHAHNEYLQLLAATGVIGAGISIFGATLFTRSLITAMRTVKTPVIALDLVALSICLVLPLLHALVDFPFRIPSLGVSIVVVAALTWRLRKRIKTTETL